MLDIQDVAGKLVLPLIGTYALAAVANALIGLHAKDSNGWKRKIAEAISVTACFVGLGIAIVMRKNFTCGEPVQIVLWEMLPGVPLAFALDDFGMTFILIIAFMAASASVFKTGYMRFDSSGLKHIFRFFAQYKWAIGMGMGLAGALNLITGFMFFEGITFATLLLVGHTMSRKARRVLRIYGLLMVTAASILLYGIVQSGMGGAPFTPNGFMEAATNSHMSTAELYTYFVIGIAPKAGLIPLFFWLIYAMVAPTPASSLFHAVLVVKAGLFKLGRVVFYSFGVGLLWQTVVYGYNLMEWLGFAAALTMLSTAMLVLREDKIKGVLALLTVNSLATFVLAISNGTITGTEGAILYMSAHAIAKITLFYCAGALHVGAHVDKVSQVDGVGRVMPIVMIFFGISSSGISGIPFMVAFGSKLLMLEGVTWWQGALIMFCSLISFIRLAQIWIPSFVNQFTGTLHHTERELWIMILAIVGTTILGCIFGLWPNAGVGMHDLALGVANMIGETSLVHRIETPFVVPSWTLWVPICVAVLICVLCLKSIWKGAKEGWAYAWKCTTQIRLPQTSLEKRLTYTVIVVGLCGPALYYQDPQLIWSACGWAAAALASVFSLFFVSKFFSPTLAKARGWHAEKSFMKPLPMVVLTCICLVLPVYFHGSLPTREIATVPIPTATDIEALFSPAVVFLIAALAAAFAPSHWMRATIMLAAPVVALWLLLNATIGESITVEWMGRELLVHYIHKVNRGTAIIFSIIALICAITFAQKLSRTEQVAGLLYAGSTVGMACSGDLLIMIASCALMGLAPVAFLMIAMAAPPTDDAAEMEKRRDAYHEGWRYLIFHSLSEALILFGMTQLFQSGESYAFVQFNPETAPHAAWFIFAGLGINVALPPGGSWLHGGYSKSTLAGVALMNAFTTKANALMMVYMFAGWDALVIAAIAMVVMNTIYAVVVGGMRLILSLHIKAQVALILIVIGIGTMMGIDAGLAHNNMHQIYKTVLFIAVSIIVVATGAEDFHQLGNLVGKLPLVFVCLIIGGLSISSIPGFNGFGSKNMMGEALLLAEMVVIYWVVNWASVGTGFHTLLKLPDNAMIGTREKLWGKLNPVPKMMYVGLGVGCALCIAFGLGGHLLYDEYLPFYHAHQYTPWTPAIINKAISLMAFTTVGYMLWRDPLQVRAPNEVVATDSIARHWAPGLEKIFVGGTELIFDLSWRMSAAVARVFKALFVHGRIWQFLSRFTFRYSPEAEQYGLDLNIIATVGMILFSFLFWWVTSS